MSSIEYCLSRPPTRKREYSPYLHSFERKAVEWAIFGSLSWGADVAKRPSLGREWFPYQRHRDNRRKEWAEWHREQDFRRLMHETCKLFRIQGRKLAYYRALEFGTNDQCHYHFLVAKTGIERVSQQIFANAMQDLWQNKLKPFDSSVPGMGRAVILPYDNARELRGVKYCLELERDNRGELRERIDYPSKALIELCRKGASTIETECL